MSHLKALETNEMREINGGLTIAVAPVRAYLAIAALVGGVVDAAKSSLNALGSIFGIH